MAHSHIPTDKITAYRATDYRFDHGPDRITLHIGTQSDALARLYASSGYACGVFITAYNPLGHAHSLEANEAAHARLGAELNALAIEVMEGAGADPTGAWPEEKSFLRSGWNSRRHGLWAFGTTKTPSCGWGGTRYPY